MATPWREIKHKFSAERLAELNQEAADELERMGFGKLRLARHQTPPSRASNAAPTFCSAPCAATSKL